MEEPEGLLSGRRESAIVDKRGLKQVVIPSFQVEFVTRSGAASTLLLRLLLLHQPIVVATTLERVQSQ